MSGHRPLIQAQEELFLATSYLYENLFKQEMKEKSKFFFDNKYFLDAIKHLS